MSKPDIARALFDEALPQLAMGRLQHLNLASNTTVHRLRECVPPGHYHGTATYILTFDITVGEDYEGEVAQSVPWKALAGILFGKLNPQTREKLIREALVRDENGGFVLKEDERNPSGEDALARIMGQTRKRIAGKITGQAVLQRKN